MTPTHEPTLSDKLTAEAEHAEATRQTPLKYQQRRAASNQSVYGLRLPPDRIEQLRRVASARGIEPSVLARAWLLEKLDNAEAGQDAQAVDRWEHDLRETTDRLREILDRRPDSSKTS